MRSLKMQLLLVHDYYRASAWIGAGCVPLAGDGKYAAPRRGRENSWLASETAVVSRWSCCWRKASVGARGSLGRTRCTITPTRMLSSRTPQARIARNVFSLTPKVFEGECLSVIAIVAIPRVRLEAAILAASDQMTIGLDETLRLKTPRVVKALQNPRENAGIFSGGNRCGCSSCPRN